jgi:hypothetical protein
VVAGLRIEQGGKKHKAALQCPGERGYGLGPAGGVENTGRLETYLGGHM